MNDTYSIISTIIFSIPLLWGVYEFREFRFQIEDIATNNSIPILAIVIKQSIHEALTIMTKGIADQASSVRSEIQEMIRDNTQPKQTVMIIGVGNTLGVSQ